MEETLRLESALDLGKRMGRQKERRQKERITQRKHPEEIPKANKVGSVSIYISSNSLTKALLTNSR